MLLLGKLQTFLFRHELFRLRKQCLFPERIKTHVKFFYVDLEKKIK